MYALPMGKAEWGAEPEFFGPRHAHREGRIVRRLREVASGARLHLECAAGVGSLALALARGGRCVVAADLSVRSLLVLRDRAETAGLGRAILPVLADVTQLPFADGSFDSASTAETLEHVPNHDDAAAPLVVGGALSDAVPVAPAEVAGMWC